MIYPPGTFPIMPVFTLLKASWEVILLTKYQFLCHNKWYKWSIEFSNKKDKNILVNNYLNQCSSIFPNWIIISFEFYLIPAFFTDDSLWNIWVNTQKTVLSNKILKNFISESKLEKKIRLINMNLIFFKIKKKRAREIRR